MRITRLYRILASLVLPAVIILSAACGSQGAAAPAGKASVPASVKGSAATTAAQPSTPQSQKSAQPYDIDFMISLTGIMAAAFHTQKIGLDAYQKYVNSHGGINGRPVNFVYHDDQGDPKVAVQIATDLIAKKVPVIMGPGITPSVNAVAPLIAANGPVAYCTSPAVDPKPGSYLFAAMPSNMDTFKSLLTFFRNKGWTKIAMLSTTDASGAGVADAVTSLVKLPENSSMSIVADERTDPTATSMSAQAARIKASHAQAIILAALGAPANIAFKALAQAGIDLPVGTAVANQNYTTMNVNKAFLPKELYFPGAPSDVPEVLPNGATKTLILDYRKLMDDSGNKPEVSNIVAWDVGSIIVEALRKTGTDTTPAKVRDAIQSIRGFQGLWGTYNFSTENHRGVGADNVYVERWDAGKDRWVGVSGPGGAPLKS